MDHPSDPTGIGRVSQRENGILQFMALEAGLGHHHKD